jgi:hypothetical protein
MITSQCKYVLIQWFIAVMMLLYATCQIWINLVNLQQNASAMLSRRNIKRTATPIHWHVFILRLLFNHELYRCMYRLINYRYNCTCMCNYKGETEAGLSPVPLVQQRMKTEFGGANRTNGEDLKNLGYCVTPSNCGLYPRTHRWESVSRICAIQTALAWWRRLHNVQCSMYCVTPSNYRLYPRIHSWESVSRIRAKTSPAWWRRLHNVQCSV